MSFVDILQDKKKINKLLSYIDICHDNIIYTRNKTKRQSSSCRLWQLKYMIIYYINLKKKNIILKNLNKLNEIGNILFEICNIIDNVLNDKNSSLHDLIVLNKAKNIQPIYSINQLKIKSKYENFCLCIYNPSNMIILHYFTIIYKHPKFYITSSYGSDYVCVPQHTQELNIEEFEEFCLGIIDNNEIRINFFEKYFLFGNLKKRYNNNTIENINPRLKSKWIQKKEGVAKELENVFNPKSINISRIYQIGFLYDYNESIEELIDLHFHST